MPFDWKVHKTDWPPRAEVKPPFSLTRVEIARFMSVAGGL